MEEAFEVLKDEILLRLRHGYRLYDVRSSYSVEIIRGLFPDNAVAFRSVEGSELDADDEIRRQLTNQYAQLPLFTDLSELNVVRDTEADT